MWAGVLQAPLPMAFSRKNTGVGCHSLLQGIFLTQGSNLSLLPLLHWQTGSLSLSNPNEFEWTPGAGDEQGGLVCCDSWGRKESDTTEWLNWTEEANLEQAESEFFLWHTVCGPGKRTSVLSLMKMEIWDPSCFPIVDFNKVGHCKGSLNLRKRLLIKTELKLVHSCFLSS